MNEPVKAELKYLKIAPRKMQDVANLVKGSSLKDAQEQLRFNPRMSAASLFKLLKSAESNAVNNFKLSPDKLFIKEIKVDSGPMLKRYMPRARGRATVIRRKMSHVSVVLAEPEENASVNSESLRKNK